MRINFYWRSLLCFTWIMLPPGYSSVLRCQDLYSGRQSVPHPCSAVVDKHGVRGARYPFQGEQDVLWGRSERSVFGVADGEAEARSSRCACCISACLCHLAGTSEQPGEEEEVVYRSYGGGVGNGVMFPRQWREPVLHRSRGVPRGRQPALRPSQQTGLQ